MVLDQSFSHTALLKRKDENKGDEGASHPEDVGGCALVGGLERHEGDAVVQGRVAQHAGPENGVLRDVTRGVDTRENVRETLLDGFGVSVPHQLLRAGLLHFTLRGQETLVRARRQHWERGPAFAYVLIEVLPKERYRLKK